MNIPTTTLAGVLTLSAWLSPTLAAPAALPLTPDPGDPTWVPLTVGTPEGSPAEINVLTTSSNVQQTTVEVVIHGFWESDVTAENGTTYQRISIPGLSMMGEVGAPELPVARFALGVVTDATEARLIGVDELAGVTLAGRNIYPTPTLGEDEEIDPTEDPGPGDTLGSEEVFSINDAIYGLTTDWPTVPDAGPAPTQMMFGHVPGALCETHPVTYNPSTGDLNVSTNTLYVFTHAGTEQTLAPATKKKVGLLKKLFVNSPSVGFKFNIDPVTYHSRYLIVTRSSYVGSIGFFMFHKKLLGYDTEFRVPKTLDFEGVYKTIKDWYAEGDSGTDHFVLLLGDTNTIPTYDLPLGLGETDDLYANMDNDFSKEIHLGRISVDGPSDIINQFQKIIQYERFPVPFGKYHRAVLVAHDQEAPFKYTLAHLQVATASYSAPITFDLQFGYAGATDSSVRSSINSGAGLVAYRGHGSTNAWTDWNPDGDDFHKNDVLALTNTNNIRPVVWSIACTNSNISAGTGSADCFGEAWLEASGMGGVAHYGATGTTGTSFNHLLDKRLFKIVYDDGITTHGMALDYTELLMYLTGWQGKENWRYMLLGDPAMQIRLEPPTDYAVSFPPNFFSSSDGNGDTTDVMFNIADLGGEPGEGLQVSLYKPALIPGEADEILTNTYADEFGVANFVVELKTPGTLYYSVKDEKGNVNVGEFVVDMSAAWRDVGGGAPGLYGTPKLVGTGPLKMDEPMSLVLTDAAENLPAWLVVGFSELNAPFKGGVLVPKDDLVIAGLATNGDGAFALTSPWPGGTGSGFQFWSQFWIKDAAAPLGFAGSNGLLGTTP